VAPKSAERNAKGTLTRFRCRATPIPDAAPVAGRLARLMSISRAAARSVLAFNRVAPFQKTDRRLWKRNCSATDMFISPQPCESIYSLATFVPKLVATSSRMVAHTARWAKRLEKVMPKFILR